VEYQLSYSPALNPIEYLFESVKASIRKRSQQEEDLILANFQLYLQMQVRKVELSRHNTDIAIQCWFTAGLPIKQTNQI
jgi:transposase